MASCFGGAQSGDKSSKKIRKKFRGALLGAFLGDCLGAQAAVTSYRQQASQFPKFIQRCFDRLEKNQLAKEEIWQAFYDPFYPDLKAMTYTDNTAMMKSMAKFLIDKPVPDMVHLAELLVSDCFREKNRYDSDFVKLCDLLYQLKYKDVFDLMRGRWKVYVEQIWPEIFGNESATRIAPVALYFYDNFEDMLHVVVESSKITHNTLVAINGAVLQSIAIQQALMADPDEPLNVYDFCDNLLEKMGKVEVPKDDIPIRAKDTFGEYLDGPSYCVKIKEIKRFLAIERPNYWEMVEILGNRSTAYKTVPIAIYCFLRATKHIPGIETDDPLRRTIQFALWFRGDSDAIACMAGAIAGAFFGAESVNLNILLLCEKYKKIEKLANKLYAAKSRRKYRSMFSFKK